MTLQVACEGFVISNSVIFEYKKPPSDENKVKEVQYNTVFYSVCLVRSFCYNIYILLINVSFIVKFA